ncbi:MAG: hypothetical protein DRJ32_03200 [Thermoprotei archaeon]|nr:MAG: hypothetical protein DRJ32_03200 [Thermoprotei archaeon]
MKEIEEVWEIIRDKVDISLEDFINEINKVKSRLKVKLSDRAVAIIVARKLGVDVTDIFTPPVIGRVLELGIVKRSETRGPYRLFTLVNEKIRQLCVAFGREHVEWLKDKEDKAIKISKYVMAPFGGGKILRVTEKSIMEELPDDALPPIVSLQPALSPTIAGIKDKRGSWIVSGVILMEDISEFFSCPQCRRSLEFIDNDWVCPVHGVVEPETRRVFRYQIADETGIYSAVYYGEPVGEELTNRAIKFKASFKGDELVIFKIYEITPIEA